MDERVRTLTSPKPLLGQFNTSPLALKALPAFTASQFPVLSVASPAYTDPAMPTLTAITEPGDMEAVNPISLPTAPSITMSGRERTIAVS